MAANVRPSAASIGRSKCAACAARYAWRIIRAARSAGRGPWATWPDGAERNVVWPGVVLGPHGGPSGAAFLDTL